MESGGLLISAGQPLQLQSIAIRVLKGNARPAVFRSRGCLLPVLLFCLHCVDFHRSESQIQSALSGQKVTEATIKVEDYSIHALSVGPEDGQPVLLIHGSPGSWDNYLDLIQHFQGRAPSMPEDSSTEPGTGDSESSQTSPTPASDEKQQEYLLIFYDRPGFGRTTPARALADLTAQSEVAHAVLKHFSSRAAVVVGHSYGGPIAIQMALDGPDSVQSLVLVGASVDPALEELRWYNHAANWFSGILPGALIRSNLEMLPLKKQLQSQKDQIDQRRNMPPVYVLHGTDDSLVPVENANYVYSMFASRSPFQCIQTLEGKDHFLPWNDAKRMANTIRMAARENCPVSETYGR